MAAEHLYAHFLALVIKVCVMLGLSLPIKLMLIGLHKGRLFGYTN